VEGVDFFNELERAIRESYPKPKMMILGFPSNPTAGHLHNGGRFPAVIHDIGIGQIVDDQDVILLRQGEVRSVPLVEGVDFFNELERAIRESYPKPKMMILGCIMEGAFQPSYTISA
jgi:aspartate/methionine/tyrosine aminotransferase